MLKYQGLARHRGPRRGSRRRRGNDARKSGQYVENRAVFGSHPLSRQRILNPSNMLASGAPL